MDWTDNTAQLSKHFTVKEAIYLPQWGRMATTTDGLDEDAQAALIGLFNTLDAVRDMLGVPMIVHVAFRPKLYNFQIGGASESAHMARNLIVGDSSYLIAACDFHPAFSSPSIIDSCNKGKSMLSPYLYKFNLRMENNPNQGWIHLDNCPVASGMNRVFIP